MRGLWSHADFYQDMFQISTRKVCPEMMLFLRDYNALKTTKTASQSQLATLYKAYIWKLGQFQLNLPITATSLLHDKIKLQQPLLLTDFAETYKLVEGMIFDNIYLDYVLTRHASAKSSTIKTAQKHPKAREIIKSQPIL